MPSTTTNYGWTYPISSDDLNAGATSVGSLASGIDASLATEASTRAAADANRYTKAEVDAGLANKIQVGTFHYGTYVITRTAGQFFLGGYGVNSSVLIDGDNNASGGLFISAGTGIWGDFMAMSHTGGVASGAFRVNAFGW